MNPSTLFIPASGRVVDIFAPRAADIDLDDIPEHLSKEARYNGGTPHAFYSVAQHLVLGADWILTPTYSQEWAIHFPWKFEEDPPLGASDDQRLAAAYFLAHDFHEYVLKDETTPKKRALDRVAEDFGVLAGAVAEAFARLVERWDDAIHKAAGLPWPMPVETNEYVKRIDTRMLLTEWATLHKGHKLLGDYSAYEPLPIRIDPWDWRFAQEMLASRMALLLPNCRVKGRGQRRKS